MVLYWLFAYRNDHLNNCVSGHPSRYDFDLDSDHSSSSFSVLKPLSFFLGKEVSWYLVVEKL